MILIFIYILHINISIQTNSIRKYTPDPLFPADLLPLPTQFFSFFIFSSSNLEAYHHSFPTHHSLSSHQAYPLLPVQLHTPFHFAQILFLLILLHSILLFPHRQFLFVLFIDLSLSALSLYVLSLPEWDGNEFGWVDFKIFGILGTW